MNKSETLKELATALAKAQAAIKGALKDTNNPFFKSKYADLASVVEAIREPLATNGLSYVQIAHDGEASAKIETLILHSSGEWLSSGIVSVPVVKSDAQGFGSAMTYARRYSLSAAFGVAPEDDDGNAASKTKTNTTTSALKSEFPTGHEKVPGTEKTVGQVVDENLAMERIEDPQSRDGIRTIAKAIETAFYEQNAKMAVDLWHKERSTMNEAEVDALWEAMNPTVRNNLKKCEEAMRKAA